MSCADITIVVLRLTYKVFFISYTQKPILNLNSIDLNSAVRNDIILADVGAFFRLVPTVLQSLAVLRLRYINSSLMDSSEICQDQQNIFICDRPEEESGAVQILDTTWIDGAG